MKMKMKIEKEKKKKKTLSKASHVEAGMEAKDKELSRQIEIMIELKSHEAEDPV